MDTNIEPTKTPLEVAKEQTSEEIREHLAEQISSQDSFTKEQATVTAFNILNTIPRQPLEARKTAKSQIQQEKDSGDEEGAAHRSIEAKGESGQSGDFQDNNQQFQNEAKKYIQHDIEKLLALRDKVKTGASQKSILDAVNQLYPSDADLAQDALEFLLNTSDNIADENTIRQVKTEYEELKRTEIEQGRSIGQDAINSGANPAELRKLYRDVTHDNPLDPKPLFTALRTRYQGQDLNKVYKFLLSTAGGETKLHGSDINPAIIRVIKEIRVLQCLIAMIAFFKREKKRTLKALHKYFLDLDIEELETASLFLDLASSSYPDAQYYLSTVNNFIEEKRRKKELSLDPIQLVNTQIILTSLMRDAVPQVSKELYKRLSSEDEKTTDAKIVRVQDALIVVLENLENNLEDLIDAQEKEKE